MKPVSAPHAPAESSARLADVHDAIVSCQRCPRLRAYCGRIAREKKRAFRHDTYWGRPVPGFGDPRARLLIVGLAPAAHGGNRTGRVFTGDGPGASGDFLMSALHRTGFANIATSERIDDGLQLTDAYIFAAVRCAPPGNKPLPEEITRCLDHADAEVAHLPRVRVVVALGKIGFDAWLQLLRRRGITPSPRPQFAHGATFQLTGNRTRTPEAEAVADTGRGGLAAPPVLIGCYHPSRQNTNTGKLTPPMMEEVFRRARAMLEE
jgi:uracil-DNA glycosylase family 4